MNDPQIPPGRLLRPEGKVVPTHDQFGDAHDEQNAMKGAFPWLIVAIAVVAVTLASWQGWL